MMLRLTAALLLMLICCSCIQLKGSDPPDRYYILTPLTGSSPVISSEKLIITIELVEFPTYLKRPQIVIKEDDNSFRISDAHRWGTPLEDGILNLLRRNLSQTFPAADIAIVPWQRRTTADHRIRIDIDGFSAYAGDRSDIDIHWHIASALGEARQGRIRIAEPFGGGPEELVKTLNQSLDQLSLQLARNLAAPAH